MADTSEKTSGELPLLSLPMEIVNHRQALVPAAAINARFAIERSGHMADMPPAVQPTIEVQTPIVAQQAPTPEVVAVPASVAADNVESLGTAAIHTKQNKDSEPLDIMAIRAAIEAQYATPTDQTRNVA